MKVQSDNSIQHGRPAASATALFALAAAALLTLNADLARANGPTKTVDYTGPLGLIELTFEDDRTVAYPGIGSIGGRLGYYEASYYTGGIILSGWLNSGGSLYAINGGEVYSADWTYCTLINIYTGERIDARLDFNYADYNPQVGYVDYCKLTINPRPLHDNPSEYIFQLPRAATPTLSPNGGTFAGSVQVKLQCASAGASIYYATNGATTASLYTGPITLNASTTLNAMAVGDSYTGSAVACATFTITPINPIQLSNPVKLPDGSFEFGFTNVPGATFTVLAASSPTLPSSNWTPLGNTMEVSPGSYRFVDTQARTNSARFYRVRSF